MAHADSKNQFWISQLGQCRVEFSAEIRMKIRGIMPFKISDYGCFKNPPGWIYPVHTDTNRTFALNMMISGDNPGFLAQCYNDEQTESFPIEYIQDQWVLLNTKKFHSVQNNSTANRYVISIGCETVGYQDIYRVFKDSGNIGKIIGRNMKNP